MLLAAQQGFSMVEGKGLALVGRAILQPAAVAVGTLLAPQPAQAQFITTRLTASPGNKQVTLNWTVEGLQSGVNISWSYRYKEGGGDLQSHARIPVPGSNTNTRSYTVTGLKNNIIYSFEVQGRLTGAVSGRTTSPSPVTATPFAPPVLSTSGSDSEITASWTYDGAFRSGWKWQWKWFPHPHGGTNFGDIPTGAGTSSTRSAKFSPPNTNVRYAVRVRLVDANGNQVAESNWSLATAGGTAVPTLVSDPSKTLRAGSDGTVEVCYNLLAVIHNGVTYLEKRDGKTAVAAQAVLKNTVHGVEITEAPDVIRTLVVGVGNVNFDPCATVGVGVHRITWQWNGPNGLARQTGQTSTTFTVLPANTPDQPTGFSAAAGNAQVALAWSNPGDSSITRWEYQQKEGDGRYGAWKPVPASDKDTTSYTVTGLTNGTEYGFRIRAVNGNGAGIPSAEKTARPSNKTITLSAASTRITEGNSGRKDVTITVTLSEPAPPNFSAEILTGTQSSATRSDKSSGQCTAPLNPLDTDFCFSGSSSVQGGGSINIAAGETRGTVTLGVVGDTRNEGNETAVLAAGYADGWRGIVFTLTIVDDDGGATAGVTIEPQTLEVAEGSSGAYTVVLDTEPAGSVTVTPSESSDAVSLSPSALTFTTSNYSQAQTVTVTGEDDANTASETVTVSHTVSGYSGVSNSDLADVTVTTDDDDDPGVTIAPGALTVAEGSTGAYTVVLDTEPAGSVTITPSESSDAVSLSPTSLTFTTSNYSQAQTVTVTGEDDANTANETVTVSHTVSGYSGVSNNDLADVTVTTDDDDDDVPSAPTGLSAAAGDSQVTLSWTNPNDATITGYRVRYGKKNARSSAAWNPIAGSSASTTSHTVTSLNNNAEYSFKVRAVNSAGNGTATDWVDATPTPVAAPVLTEATSTNRLVTLTWTHGGSSAGAYISGGTGEVYWETGHRLKGATSWATTASISTARGNSRRTVSEALANVYPNGAALEVRVRARTNTGTGPWSNVREVTFRNNNLDPLAFTGNPLTVTAGSSSTYTVKLSKAYRGVLSLSSSATTQATVSPATLTFTAANYNTAQTVTVTGVAAGQATVNHRFRLTGATADAIPNAGTVAVTVNAAPPPSAPGNLNATAGDGQVVLTWDNPDDGSITSYKVRYAKTAERAGTPWNPVPNAGASSTSHTVGSLTNGEEYSFQVRAVNASGDGAAPAWVKATPQSTATVHTVTVPATLSVGEGDGTARVSIMATAALGKAVTFTVTYGDSGATGAANPANGDYDNDAVTSITFAAADRTKTIEIPISTDQEVEGNESFTVSIALAPSNTLPANFLLGTATTVVTITDNPPAEEEEEEELPAAPAKPTGLAAQAGNAQVTLSWNNPDNATITKWQVQQKQGDGSYGAWVDIPGSTTTTTSHTVTGLSNGTAYGFRIRAVNAGGNSPASAEVRATPLAPPLKPTGVTATAGHGQVTLSWDNPDNATISKWQYQQKQADGSYGPWMDIPGSTASTTSHTVTGLTNGVAYSFRIRAVNAGGNGAPSDEVTATPIDQDVVQADKARSQALAATSRTLLGMATDVLGSRTDPDAPMAVAGAGNSLGEQAMGIVENLLGIGGSELPTSLTLEDVEDRLWSQSFQLTPPASGMGQEWNPLSPQQRSWAVWGAGELRSYRGNDDTEHLSYSGNVKTAWLGMDHQFTDRWMAGAALSFATGQSDYSYQKTDGSKDGGKMETRLTVVYPYGSFQVSEGLRLWGMAGMGWGTQHHRQTGDHTKAEGDLRLQMGVVGFERALSPIGELSPSLAGDAGLVKSTTDWKAGSGLDDLDVSLHRIRLGIDSSFPLAEHTTAYLNLKGRLDGGDLEMNAAEIVAGLHYGKERFSGFLQGRQTYAFDGSYAESALTAQLRLTANSDGTGLAWTLQPSYGAGNGDMALAAGPSLWTDEQLEALTGSSSAQESGEMALSSRVGYGIRLQPSDLLLTPFTEMRFSEAGSQHIGLGLALQTSSWNVELSSSTEKGANSSPTTKTELNFSKQL